MSTVSVTVEGTTYELPVVVIPNTRLYRGIEADDCASVEQFRSPLPYVWVTTDPQMATKYGNCLFRFDPKPGGSVLRLLDIWTPPVIAMMDELARRSRLFNTMGKVDAWENEYTGRGLKPRTDVPTVQKIGPKSGASSKANALTIFEGSEFINGGTALKWRGLIWGDKPGEFSRYSGGIPDKLVTAIFFEIIKGTGLDGLYAPILPSFMHETVSIRNVFEEEIIILKDSLVGQYNPPQRYDSGGRRKTRRLIRRRRVRHTRHTRSHIPVTRTRHIQRKV